MKTLLKNMKIHAKEVEKNYKKDFVELKKKNKQKLDKQNILEAFAHYNQEIGQISMIEHILKESEK